jgi:hypothetical protein
MRKTRSTGSMSQRSKVEKKVQEETEKYELISKNYSKYLNCPTCKLLMKEPRRLHPCGHTFCLACTPSKGKCPTCEKKVIITQKDLVGEGLLN